MKNDEKLLSDNQVKDILASTKNISDLNQLFTQLKKQIIESMYDEELKDHLGFEKNQKAPTKRSNHRNGSYKKTVESEHGQIDLNVPRDRNSEFEPVVVPKGSKDIFEIEQKVLNLYGLGMSTRDITNHIEEIYGVQMSATGISNITNRILKEVKLWQKRPLSETYAVMFLDGMIFKVRDNNSVIKKTVYALIGINMEGFKEVVGIYVAEAETSKYWLTVLTDIKERGVQKILIFCTDNLKGLDNAITAAYPKSDHQKCIVHQIRNSVKHVCHKDMKAVCADLKAVYTAKDEASGRGELDIFIDRWGSKYEYIGKSWEKNWSELSTFWDYPSELRRLIYTTNPIESFNRTVRKFTKTKGIFPHEDSLLKSIYLGVQNIEKKWTCKIRNWGVIYSQLLIVKEDYLEA